MQIGIGLPSAISWTSPSLILEWAKKAEERNFASLGLVDRIVYPNYESLVTLAVAADATRRIGLTTSVLLAPLRNTTLLAKQAASLDNLSGGRLTLGLGIGSREDDFRATDQPFKDRGRRFDEQLHQLKRIWAGQPLSDDVGPIGPTPVRTGGPEILFEAPFSRPLGGPDQFADGSVGARAAHSRDGSGGWRSHRRCTRPGTSPRSTRESPPPSEPVRSPRPGRPVLASRSPRMTEI